MGETAAEEGGAHGLLVAYVFSQLMLDYNVDWKKRTLVDEVVGAGAGDDVHDLLAAYICKLAHIN